MEKKKVVICKITRNDNGEFIDLNYITPTELKKGDIFSITESTNIGNNEELLDFFNFAPKKIMKAMADVETIEHDSTYYSIGKVSYLEEEDLEDATISQYLFPSDVFIFDEAEIEQIFAENEKLKKSSIQKFFPKNLLKYLNQYIVGQEDAKKKLCIEIFKHYCRMTGDEKYGELPKDNVLMTGPTGCGKTYILEKLADYINVPFAKCSCTSLTAAGYVGDDVESVIQDLIAKAEGDIEKAQFGIVFFDEIDKIGRKSETISQTRDVGGEGVQQALLAMLGGTTIKVPASGKKRMMGETIDFDTSNVLFIGAGCFEGIEDVVKSKMNIGKKTIGFTQADTTQKVSELESMNNLRAEINREDLKKFGMIPELLGRFGVLTNLLELDKEALINICKLENGEINKYKNLFTMFDKNLILNESLYENLADIALKNKTGARGVKTALSELLTEYTFNIDDEETTDVEVAIG